jgi:hypothetical protein
MIDGKPDLEVLVERISNMARDVAACNSKIDMIIANLRTQFITREEYNKDVARMVTLDRYVWIERTLIGIVTIMGSALLGAMAWSVIIHK